MGKTRLPRAKSHSKSPPSTEALSFKMCAYFVVTLDWQMTTHTHISLFIQVLVGLIAARGETQIASCFNGNCGLKSKLYLVKGIPFPRFMFSEMVLEPSAHPECKIRLWLLLLQVKNAHGLLGWQLCDYLLSCAITSPLDTHTHQDSDTTSHGDIRSILYAPFFKEYLA